MISTTLATVVSLVEAIPCSEFTFIVNDATFTTSIIEAIKLSPAVQMQLSVDACARRFIIYDSKIDSTAFSSLQRLCSHAEVLLEKKLQTSLVLLSRWLCNPELEQLFFGLWGKSSDSIVQTLSTAFMRRSRVNLHSISDLSLLSVDALDSLLSNESFVIGNEDTLLQTLLSLQQPSLLRHCRLIFLSQPAIATFFDESAFHSPTEVMWHVVADRMKRPPVPKFDSLIISKFPTLFIDFRGKRFNLLWRGSRDGFSATQFHHCCDGHPNTLTIVMDTRWNVFGGFTPITWETRIWNGMRGDNNNCCKSDRSMRSFLFTLKNPHNIPPKRFPLRPEMKDSAIRCDADRGPVFGRGDLGVSSYCNSNTRSATGHFGSVYTNDTGINGGIFFVGSGNFMVKEIEVFEILD
jgi:hypothetical protein